MAKTAGMFTETTAVPVGKSVAEITDLLVRAGAMAISTNYRADRSIESLSFVIPVSGGRIPYLLPIRVDPVFERLWKRRVRKGWGPAHEKLKAQDREQAGRIAWRQMFWWLKSQLALIDLGMVRAEEVLMPYMLANDGRTFFEVYQRSLEHATCQPPNA